MILPILVLALIVATFGALLVYAASLVGPKKKKTAAKYMPYECGLPGQENKKPTCPFDSISQPFCSSCLI